MIWWILFWLACMTLLFLLGADAPTTPRTEELRRKAHWFGYNNPGTALLLAAIIFLLAPLILLWDLLCWIRNQK